MCKHQAPRGAEPAAAHGPIVGRPAVQMGVEVNKPPTILVPSVLNSAQEEPIAGAGRVSEPSVVLLHSVLTCVEEPRRLGECRGGVLQPCWRQADGAAPGVSAEWGPLVSTVHSPLSPRGSRPFPCSATSRRGMVGGSGFGGCILYVRAPPSASGVCVIFLLSKVLH